MKDALFSLDVAADGTSRRSLAEPFRPRRATSPERPQPPVATEPLPAA